MVYRELFNSSVKLNKYYTPAISLNSSSVRMVIPNSSALASLLPAEAPATTYDVFLLTLPLVLAPNCSASSSASLRVIETKLACKNKRFSQETLVTLGVLNYFRFKL